MKAFLFALLSLASAAPAFSAPMGNLDGCYELYNRNSDYAIACLSGTNEEGIGGSGARLAVLDFDTFDVLSCASSQSIKITEKTFTFVAQDSDLLVLKNLVSRFGTIQGEAVLAGKELKFTKRYEESLSSRMLAKVKAAKECQALNPGEVRNINQQ